MNKLKELWKRSAILQTLTVLLIAYVAAAANAFIHMEHNAIIFGSTSNESNENFMLVIWFPILGLSLLWIWRRLLWRICKRVLRIFSWIDKKAEEG